MLWSDRTSTLTHGHAHTHGCANRQSHHDSQHGTHRSMRMYQTPSQGQGVEAIVQTSSTHSVMSVGLVERPIPSALFSKPLTTAAPHTTMLPKNSGQACIDVHSCISYDFAVSSQADSCSFYSGQRCRRTAQRKPATDTVQPSVIQDHMGTGSIAVEMFKSTSSLHQRLDGTKVDTSLKWFASSPHSFPTLRSRSPCASWAPPLPRGLVRGFFPAPHHHDPNGMLPNFQIWVMVDANGGCRRLRSHFLRAFGAVGIDEL